MYLSEHTEVRCIVWDPQEDFIVRLVVNDNLKMSSKHFCNFVFSGMSNGQIYVHNYPALTVRMLLKMHTDTIVDIQFSMKQTYMASCDVSGYVLVWHTKTFKPFIKCVESCESLIAWHPWKEDNIIVGKLCEVYYFIDNYQ